jgi:hypothetical protein
MPSGPNAENAKDLYNKAKGFHQTLQGMLYKPTLFPTHREEADRAFNDLAAKGKISGYAPRTAREALDIVGEGNMGVNVPQSPRGRRGSMDDPKSTRKGRLK